MAGKCCSNANSKRLLREALRGAMGVPYLDLSHAWAKDIDMIDFYKGSGVVYLRAIEGIKRFQHGTSKITFRP